MGASYYTALDTPAMVNLAGGNVNLRLRLLIENTGADATTPSFKYRYSYDGGAYTDITSSSSYVKTFDSSYFADGDDCGTALIGADALITNNNAAEESTGTFTMPVDFTGSADIETEIALTIVAADWTIGKSLAIRLTLSDGTALAIYTNTAVIKWPYRSGLGSMIGYFSWT